MIEATVTGIVCGHAPQTSREVGDGLTRWTLTLLSATRDGRPFERVDVSWVGDRTEPFLDGDDLIARGELHICSCGGSPRLLLRASELREVHAETRARYAEACARHAATSARRLPTLRLAADGGNDAA